MLSFAAIAVSSTTISDISLSIPDIVVASFAASASALAATTILLAEAEGGVRSMACITLTILCFVALQLSPLQPTVVLSSVKISSVPAPENLAA
jgi:hypothetical protein